MKRLFTTLLILVAIGPLMGCQKKTSNKGTIVPYRGHRGYPETGFQNGYANPYYNPGMPRSGGSYANPGRYSPCGANASWGAIHGGNTFTDMEFNNFIQDFVWDPAGSPEIGYVSSRLNDSTGVMFCGYAETANGRIDPNGNNNTTIRNSNFILHLTIWDEFAGDVGPNGTPITEYAVDVKPGSGGAVQGEVRGREAWVRFQQTWTNSAGQARSGWIEIYGTFDPQYFSGFVRFDNAQGAVNYLGEFYIETCGFFRCY